MAGCVWVLSLRAHFEMMGYVDISEDTEVAQAQELHAAEGSA